MLINIDKEADEYDEVGDPILPIIKVVTSSSRMIILRLISIKAKSPRRKGSRSGGNLVFKIGMRP